VLDRVSVPDFDLDDYFIDPDQMAKENPAMNAPHKGEPTHKSNEFAINLVVYTQVTAGICPLCG
jgi:hypothetical protein